MTLKDLLKKHSKIQSSARKSTERPLSGQSAPDGDQQMPIPEFTFLRTTTLDEEVIHPPTFASDNAPITPTSPTPVEKKRRSIFRRTSSTRTHRSTVSIDSRKSEESNGHSGLATPPRPKAERRLSDRFSFHNRPRALTRENSSSNLPPDLGDPPEAVLAPLEPPDAKGRVVGLQSKEARLARECEWERRATLLAMNNPVLLDFNSGLGAVTEHSRQEGARKRSGSFVDEKEEDNIQEAIRLHESGDLERSTHTFGRLADPHGANNPLSQVLYGLALRHGWGVDPSAANAIYYLSLAASTSGAIERAALDAGAPGGGEAKGELVLAMFELANCFRFGWGTKVDKVAARQYYEVAANLGDPDALEEAAWCCMEGYGGSKDKFRAAQYLRLAEVAGRKRVGDSWIWKDKYHPPAAT